MLTDKRISVVVTCYRDEGSVEELLRRLHAAMAEVSNDWEVIYVNDASPDNAEEALLAASSRYPRLTVISHARNFGAQVAFTTGMQQASGDAVVIMDGDLQDPPELIPRFVEQWLAGHEVVYGIRAERNEGVVRNLGYKLFYRLFQHLAYIAIPLDAGEFSLMDRSVVDVILACDERDRLIRGLRAYAGFRQVGIPFVRPTRFSGESTQSLLDYIMWTYKSITSFSLAPLRFISVFSFIITGILMALVFFYLVSFLISNAVPQGITTLILLILGCSSVIMLSLGILAEYLGRLFLEVKGRPQPVVRLVLNDQRPEPYPWLGRRGPRPPPNP